VARHVQPSPRSRSGNANGRGKDKYELVAEQVHPHEGDEGGVLGVTGNAGLCIVPPPPVHVLEAMEDKPSNIILGVLNLERRLEHTEQQLENLLVTLACTEQALTRKDAELVDLKGRHQDVLAGLEQARSCSSPGLAAGALRLPAVRPPLAAQRWCCLLSDC
jgi:hypothetical protein